VPVDLHSEVEVGFRIGICRVCGMTSRISPVEFADVGVRVVLRSP
jgi:hypothetical protein